MGVLWEHMVFLIFAPSTTPLGYLCGYVDSKLCLPPLNLSLLPSHGIHIASNFLTPQLGLKWTFPGMIPYWPVWELAMYTHEQDYCVI